MKGIDMNVARMGVGVAGAMGRARRRWPRFVGCVPAAEKVAASAVRAMTQKLTDPRCPQDAQRAAVFDAIAVIVRIAMNDGGCLERLDDGRPAEGKRPLCWLSRFFVKKTRLVVKANKQGGR